jgi:hypothetical protein
MTIIRPLHWKIINAGEDMGRKEPYTLLVGI